tara:strand:+ start:3084 stop:3695 length:612 start_codon:yes stop_codon:yes gene_type:complete
MASEGGLRPYSSLTGTGAGNAPTVSFSIVTGEASNIFQGDVVKLVNDGTVVAMAAAGDEPVLGVFVGCTYVNSDGQTVESNKYTDAIARIDTVAHIIVDPFQLYKIRIADSDVDTTLQRSTIGLNYDIEFNAGNSTTGQSGMVLDGGVTGITTQANLRLVGLTNDDGTSDFDGTATTSAKTYTHGIVMIDPQISFWLGAAPGL